MYLLKIHVLDIFQIISSASNLKNREKSIICNVFSEDRSIKRRFRPAAALKKSYCHLIEILQAKSLNEGYPLLIYELTLIYQIYEYLNK